MEFMDEPNWDYITILADDTIRLINEYNISEIIPNRIYQFFEDVDVRRKDVGYARWQLDHIRDEHPELF